MAKFTVDTHLFRELGELLVGRDSTALVELIKNSYDADSTYAIVRAQSLDNPSEGWIEISDDGIGMTPSIFNEGFLRIASRLKAAGARRSLIFDRRITGEKGIGRLAAHKLARTLTVVSIPRTELGDTGVSAQIDWEAIESVETFDDLDDVPVYEVPSNGEPAGTRIRLTGLRRGWTSAELGRFLAEVETFEAPDLLKVDLAGNPDVHGPLAVGAPTVRDVGGTDPGFSVHLEGDLDRGDDYWSALWGEIDWILEIDAKGSQVEYSIAPTRFYLKTEPHATGATFSGPHPEPDEGPFFEARVFIREGRIGEQQRRTWARRVSGIRVYYEGFRVLPYGEPGNDWIGIEQRSTQRTRDLPWLSQVDFEVGEVATDEGLITPRNDAVTGAVFLTEGKAPTLRMLVNREGFVPERGFYVVRDIVRIGVDLSTRVRASASAERREARRRQRRDEIRDAPDLEREDGSSLQESLSKLGEVVKDADSKLDEGDVAAVKEALSIAVERADEISDLTGAMIAERAMLRVLASIGLQMSAFVHETNTTLRMAGDLESEVERLKSGDESPKTTRRQLATIVRALGDLRRNVERQAAFLLDVATPDARRRRSAQPLRERFESAAGLVEARASKQEVQVLNEIPASLKSPPMFPAEVTTIFMNLLTNAVKAAGVGGQILASASLTNDRLDISIANTGTEVNLETAERWFRPFESTTVQVDPVLGQGLGLGLPITRSVVEEYGGDIRFVSPPAGYSSAVQVSIPGGRQR